MKIHTQLDPADMLPYKPGASAVSKAGGAARSFKLDAHDLEPKKPGVSSAAGPAGAAQAITPADLGSFKAGHPREVTGTRARKPFNLEQLSHASPTKSAADAATAAKSPHEQITETTQKWVSQAFYGTLLKQMGDSPFKSELFSGGRGGQAFSSMYHQQLADRMAHAAGTKLVDSIVKKIEAKQATEKAAGYRVPEAERKSSSRPTSQEDPRAKAYHRGTAPRAKQSTFSLAA